MISRRDSRRAHFGAWRAACALPSLLGSLLVLVTAFGWLGSWSGLVLVGWLLVAAAVLSVPGERAAVRLAYRYRDLSVRQAALFDPARRHAHCTVADCRRTDSTGTLSPTMRGVNGCAAGGRSVAVSLGFLDALEHGHLSQRRAVAILTQEAAHHLDRATRYCADRVADRAVAPWH